MNLSESTETSDSSEGEDEVAQPQPKPAEPNPSNNQVCCTRGFHSRPLLWRQEYLWGVWEDAADPHTVNNATCKMETQLRESGTIKHLHETLERTLTLMICTWDWVIRRCFAIFSVIIFNSLSRIIPGQCDTETAFCACFHCSGTWMNVQTWAWSEIIDLRFRVSLGGSWGKQNRGRYAWFWAWIFPRQQWWREW